MEDLTKSGSRGTNHPCVHMLPDTPKKVCCKAGLPITLTIPLRRDYVYAEPASRNSPMSFAHAESLVLEQAVPLL